MKIFVSGAAGFIGRAVTAELARRGHQVIAFDIKAAPRTEGNVKYIEGDLLKGGQWRSEILSCDKVISLTKPFSEGEDIAEKEAEEYGNRHAEEVSSLLDAMAEGQAKTVLATYDTLCLGERKGKTITDTDEINPVGYCKPLAESFRSVRNMASEHDLKVVSVFPARVYGIGDWFMELVRNIQRGTANIVEPGDNYLSLISIDDCAAMYADITEKVERAESYILSDNAPVTQEELIRFISGLLGVRVPQMIGFDAYAKKFGRLEAETMSASIKVSSEKALMELDHELKYPRYEEGVMDVIESMGLEVRRRGGLRAA